ncbi:hypothetical protein A2617_01945 [Candidatus Daviesbacteria bacterium RIFOXYD1_FULL_41_10]|uniref:Uncharacterized protein n=2 Tax=Candidatus Daviesiibacteriota TaxID=1752718 RepID=A0A1F5N0V2_9BACT|nr:MAG: hypothetical protein UU67_C0002G0017 [Candidatus Daviesbacteria bacterium GW2011_GWB1_41_5]OGE71266.1 MAG: hypothetical protein A2617_01945 [Candidatus Daviesbacteria bacterium RIFOXYD1_FULL_41_10]
MKLIENLLADNFKIVTKEDALHNLHDQFMATVRSSSEFNGIAVGEAHDELKRTRLIIYLAESDRPLKDIDYLDISEPLAAMALVLRSYNVFVDTIHVRQSCNKSLAEKVLEDMKERYSPTPEPKLLYLEIFSAR